MQRRGRPRREVEPLPGSRRSAAMAAPARGFLLLGGRLGRVRAQGGSVFRGFRSSGVRYGRPGRSVPSCVGAGACGAAGRGRVGGAWAAGAGRALPRPARGWGGRGGRGARGEACVDSGLGLEVLAGGSRRPQSAAGTRSASSRGARIVPLRRKRSECFRGTVAARERRPGNRCPVSGSCRRLRYGLFPKQRSERGPDGSRVFEFRSSLVGSGVFSNLKFVMVSQIQMLIFLGFFLSGVSKTSSV